MTASAPALAAGALSEAERFDWLRLLRCENIGPRSFHALVSRHGGAGAALEALPALIASGKAGRPIRVATIEETEQELELVRRSGAVLIGLDEPDYPPLLRKIDSAPPLIAARGDLSSLRRSKIAIVGSRNASAAGLAFTEQIARAIARAGHVIVSGLARGIDVKAHQAALETGTIAVLAGGLAKSTPPTMSLCSSSFWSMVRRSAKCPSSGRRGAGIFRAATASSRGSRARSSWSRPPAVRGR